MIFKRVKLFLNNTTKVDRKQYPDHFLDSIFIDSYSFLCDLSKTIHGSIYVFNKPSSFSYRSKYSFYYLEEKGEKTTKIWFDINWLFSMYPGQTHRENYLAITGKILAWTYLLSRINMITVVHQFVTERKARHDKTARVSRESYLDR